LLDAFGIVASRHSHVYRLLDALPRGTFCEWGSAMGVNLGIAAMLGYKATGIELEPAVADASRQLLADFGLEATVLTGSYYDIDQAADYYYVYCWPTEMTAVQTHFVGKAPDAAKLLICHGAEDIRCKVKSPDGTDE
jgi:hypothetical protein